MDVLPRGDSGPRPVLRGSPPTSGVATTRGWSTVGHYTGSQTSGSGRRGLLTGGGGTSTGAGWARRTETSVASQPVRSAGRPRDRVAGGGGSPSCLDTLETIRFPSTLYVRFRTRMDTTEWGSADSAPACRRGRVNRTCGPPYSGSGPGPDREPSGPRGSGQM